MVGTIEGAVTGGHGRPWGSPLVDLDALGYVEEEWLLAGDATAYDFEPGTAPGVDGRWQTRAVEAIPYRTRVVVRRPADASAFSGTVVVSWSNVSAGFEILQWEGPETFAAGHVTVGVSAQRVGLTGYKADPRGLLPWDPERYGSLSIPTDAASYGIFADAIGLVAPGRPSPMLPGFDTHRCVATGASQSAMRLHTYLNGVHHHIGVVDAYIFDVYAGNAAPLTRASAGGPGIPAGHLRDDTGARIFHTNSETEAAAFAPLRRPDDDRFVYWEIAGMAHGGASGLVTAAKNTRDFGFPLAAPVERPAHIVPNEIDKQPVEDASLRCVHDWLVSGQRPPSIPPIEVVGEPPEVARDEHGIARGGLRLPQVEVPVETLSGVNDGSRMDQLVGMRTPFQPDTLRELYPDHATYIRRFSEAADAAVVAGYLLPRDADAMIAAADAAPVPG